MKSLKALEFEQIRTRSLSLFQYAEVGVAASPWKLLGLLSHICIEDVHRSALSSSRWKFPSLRWLTCLDDALRSPQAVFLWTESYWISVLEVSITEPGSSLFSTSKTSLFRLFRCMNDRGYLQALCRLWVQRLQWSRRQTMWLVGLRSSTKTKIKAQFDVWSSWRVR